MKVAYVHDWLVSYRGGEKVLEVLARLYPKAPIYTLFYDPHSVPESLRGRDVRTPFISRPLVKLRKALLPLLPKLVESFDLSSYDLIISSSSCVAKGAIRAPHAKHLCYIHSPMRYIYDQQEEYLQGVRHIPGARFLIKSLTPGLQKWDRESASRVDRFIANSSFVASRVANYYQREAGVIHPPIETERFTPRLKTTERKGYLLAAGAFVSYKRFDLAIQVAESLKRPLIVAGKGPMEAQLRRLAGTHTQFEIAPSDERFKELLQGADALLFPGVEDFGLIAIEAMACGTPVIALNAGGAQDFMTPGKTGLFFAEPTVESLSDVLNAYDPSQFDASTVSRYAADYGREGFLAKIQKEIDLLIGGPAT